MNEPYEILITRLGTVSKNEFEKDFFILMKNSVFRKAMENIRNHKDMKLVTSQEKYAISVMNPNFKDEHPFSKVLLAVETEKTEIKINKLVYLGQAILSLSMYKFYHDYMRRKYGSKVKLCYMDTSSFEYEI